MSEFIIIFLYFFFLYSFSSPSLVLLVQQRYDIIYYYHTVVARRPPHCPYARSAIASYARRVIRAVAYDDTYGSRSALSRRPRRSHAPTDRRRVGSFRGDFFAPPPDHVRTKNRWVEKFPRRAGPARLSFTRSSKVVPIRSHTSSSIIAKTAYDSEI